jgi:hypothetical protein
MYVSGRRIRRFGLVATDGEIGTVEHIYIDIERCAVRYLSARPAVTGGRRIVVSPISVSNLDTCTGTIYTTVTRQAAVDGPGAMWDEAVTRSEEIRFNAAYDYGAYWSGPGLWGSAESPSTLRSFGADGIEPGEHRDTETTVLTMRRLAAYLSVMSEHGTTSIIDVLIDTASWRVAYLVFGVYLISGDSLIASLVI